MEILKNKLIILLLLFTAPLNFLFSEVISSDVFGYTIDFPEMFQIIDMTEDERSILFEHQLLPVQAAIKIWPQKSYTNSQDCLKATLGKIASTQDVTGVKWRNQSCAVSRIQMNEAVLGEKMEGWAVCTPLPQTKDYFVMLSYAPENKAYDCEQFILSLLDSIMIDRGSRREAGLITTFAFPKKGNKSIELEIEGEKIKTFMDEDDAEANQFVVDREFAVFKLFIDQQCWKEAWQRFYRLIAKDGIGRLKRPAFDISTALSPACNDADPENPSAAMAQKLLTWIQGFNYERPSATPDKADFTNIPATFTGSGSDCDSRSMLLMLLLKNMNIDSCMFISVDYSHAMAGVCLEGKMGQSYTLDEKEYLFGETTAKNVTLGMIAADMQDRTKWIPVELYD